MATVPGVPALVSMISGKRGPIKSSCKGACGIVVCEVLVLNCGVNSKSAESDHDVVYGALVAGKAFELAV